MKLSQLSAQSASSTPELRSLALSAFESEAPLFRYAEWYKMTGNADTFTTNATALGGQTRTVNNDYSPVTSSVNETTVSLKILGDVIRTDQAFERRGFTTTSERARQLESFSRSLGRFCTDQFINGDGSGSTLVGVKELIPSGQIISMGTNGDTVPLGNSDANKQKQQQFLEKLDELIGSVYGNASVIMMNYKMIARLRAIAREYINVQTVNDAFGSQQVFDSYMGVPIISSGVAKDGVTQVIGNEETVGTNDDCTSIYAIRFGEKENLSIATNNGLQVYDRGIVGVYYVTTVELDAAIALVHSKSIAQLEGIRL